MPQTALAIAAVPQANYNVQAGDLTVTLTAADAVNGNSIALTTGEVVLLAENTDTVAHTITVASAADELGRQDTSLANYSIAASTIIAIAFPSTSGWKQSDGTIHISTSSALVKFAVLRVA